MPQLYPCIYLKNFKKFYNKCGIYNEGSKINPMKYIENLVEVKEAPKQKISEETDLQDEVNTMCIEVEVNGGDGEEDMCYELEIEERSQNETVNEIDEKVFISMSKLSISPEYQIKKPKYNIDARRRKLANIDKEAVDTPPSTKYKSEGWQMKLTPKRLMTSFGQVDDYEELSLIGKESQNPDAEKSNQDPSVFVYECQEKDVKFLLRYNCKKSQ